MCGYSWGFLSAEASNESGVVEDYNFWRFEKLLLQKLQIEGQQYYMTAPHAPGG